MLEAQDAGRDAWATFESRLRTYVRRRVNPAVVDDLVGDVMLRLVQHRDEMAGAANPSAWMLRVAANAIVDHHRRRSVEQRALSRVETELPEAPKSEDGKDSTAREFATCLVPMIKTLPPPYAEALLLTDVEGLTQAEAAERLGISVSGMKSRVQRGRDKLKAALLRCCEIEVDRRGSVINYRRRQ